MSDLSSLESIHERLGKDRRPIVGATGLTQASETQTNWLEDTLFYVGKPEEWLVQLMGRVFSDDPKYRIDSTNLYDQVSFFDVAQDVTGQEGTVANLLLNLPIGLAAAILNPLDPLNIASIAKLTKVGTTGRMLSKAMRSGSITTAKGFKQIDVVAELQQLRKALGFGGRQGMEKLQRGLKVGSKRAIKAKKQLDKFKKTTVPTLSKVNDYLEIMQTQKGIPFEELLEKKTLFERVRAGQQTLIGFDPFSNPILRKMGGISKQDMLTRSAIKIKGLDAVVGKGVFPIIRAGGKAKELAITALNKLLPAGTKIPNTEVTRFIAQVISKAQKAKHAGQEFNAQKILSQYNFLGRGVGKEELFQILDELEDVFGGVEVRMLKDIIDKNPEEIFKNIRQIDRNAESIGVVGRDLTRRQKEMVGGEGVPRGFQTEDAALDANARAQRAFDAGSYHTEGTILRSDQLFVDNQSIVVRFSDKRDMIRLGLKAKIKVLAALDIPGLVPFSIVDDAKGSSLITTNIGVAPGGRWTQVHMENLEKISALMAQKGYFFKDLDPKKILVGASGELQVIDPTIIGKIRSNAKGGRVKKAADLSRETMRTKLFGKVGFSEDFDFPLLGKFESNPSIVSQVKSSDLHFQDLTPSAKRLLGDDTIRYFNTSDLLGAHNASYAKILDEETIQRLGIDVLAREIDRAGVMAPIRIRVDESGQVFISEGLERLAAARALNLEAVPVIREDFIGDIPKTLGQGLEGAEVSLRGPTRAVADVMAEKAASYDSLSKEIQNLLPQNPSILDEQNQVLGIRDSVFEPIDDSGVVYQMAEWFSRRASSDPQVQRLGSDFYEQAERAFLDAVGVDGTRVGERQAFLRLEKLLKETTDPHSLIGQLSDRLGLPHGTAQTAGSGPLAADFAAMRQELGLMKEQFRGLTQRLSDSGLFTAGAHSAAVGDYTARTGNTVLRIVGDGLEFNNLTKSATELQEIAAGYIRQQAPDLAGSTRIDLFGQTPLSTQVSSFFDEIPPGALGPILSSQTIFFASKATRKALREKNIFINPTREFLASHGLKTLKGRLALRPQGVFGVSLSGAFIFAPTHTNVGKLMEDLFGQAPRSMQEFGVFTKDGVQISNMLGLKSLSRITRTDLVPIEQRMKNIVRQLIKSGFDSEMLVKFDTPYGELWDQMFRKDLKLKDVSDKLFKLEIPDNIKGQSLELYDEAGVVGIKDRALNLPEGKVRDIFRFVEEEFDHIALRELEAGLPLNVRAGYYARFLPPELLRKLDEVGGKFFSEGNNKGYFDYYIDNFRERKLSDLTTREINKLFKDLQINPEDLVAFDKLHGSKFMKAVAEVDPQAATFFLEDPLLALSIRQQKSVKALSNQAAWEELSDVNNKLVHFKGNLEAYTKRQGVQEDIRKLWARADEATGQVNELIKDLQHAVDEKMDVKVIKSLQDQIENLEVSKGKIIDHVLDAEKFQMQSGALRGEINPLGLVNIDKNVARQLINDGILDEAADFASTNWSAPFVKVPVSVIARKGLNDLEMVIMTREAGEFLDSYFGLLNNKDGIWDNFLNKYFDPLNNLFKQTTLFLFPAVIPYTIRNFFSNTLLGWLGGVELESYKMALGGIKKISNYNRGGMPLKQAEMLLRNEKFTNAFGETQSLHEIWSGFVQGGGLTGGLHINEFGMADNVLRASVDRGFTPASNLVSGNFLLNNKLIEGGRNFAGLIENHARFAAFIDSWRKGGSFEDAALNVKKIFYNYADLNQFERQVLKRAVPFYSWMRFNTPRMLETMATNPVVHFRIKSAIADIERGAGGPADPDELPTWLSNRWGIVIGRENGKLVISDGSFLLPMGDVRRLLADPIQFTVDGLSPFLKYPPEQLFNQSLFSSRVADLFHGTGRPIERVPGEPARSGFLRRAGFTRRATPFEGPLGAMNLLMNESMVSNVRAVKWIIDWIDWANDNTNLREEAPTTWARVTDAFFSRAYTIDPDRYHAIMQIRADSMIRKFKWALKDAKKREDLELTDYWNSRITDMETRK